MNNRKHWAIVAGGLLLVAIVGAMAFYFGVYVGMEDAGRAARDYRWHPWGFGFFGPFFFIFFAFIFLRGLFWGGGYYRRCAWSGGLDEWHRRAHERMWNGEHGQREQPDDPDRRR